MKIELHKITVREVVEGYIDSQEAGVVGYKGRLNIRPPYQREFVYKERQRDAVIDTIVKGFPLNVMYWAKNEDGTFEVLDGQQRTISFCQYVTGVFSIDSRYFHNLTRAEQEKILDYELLIYFCEGNDKERLDWFKIINIAGEKLTDQELLNANYPGPWLTDAKLKFSKTGCAAYMLGKDYMTGEPIRQDYLETALKWISSGDIGGYMAEHQHDVNADPLFAYFRSVMNWISDTFIVKRKEMKGIDWGPLYARYSELFPDTAALEKRIAALMADDDVTSKKGIYPYVLTGEEKYLNVRAFDNRMKRAAYERQQGICPRCGKHFSFEEMEADHITPWSKGGKTAAENCQMLCRECNRRKSDV